MTQKTTPQQFDAWLADPDTRDRLLDFWLNMMHDRDDLSDYLRTGPHPLTDAERKHLSLSLPPEHLHHLPRYVGIYQTWMAMQAQRFQQHETELVESPDPRCPECNHFPLACVYLAEKGTVWQCARCGYYDPVELNAYMGSTQKEEEN